ncbi:PepSY domain-containing protein [Microbulbifer marinus]|uniref:Peptidase propeptide and YPEB domain-containing protein n=1 Tax=Microbulbifer marinus TaxID=658218 RepID=A0A1H4A4A3_9GAMM|nr:PepSY domain-containing protein [Microbulbifer marinus]SEA30618.1 Peptidase propeptide and YPEB domain-containing protein [Microbulbifer marinus]
MLPIKQLLAATIAAAALQPAVAEEEKPPPGAMALSTVLTKLEQQGFTPIIGVTLENGRWEVEAYKGAEKRELEVDPNTAEILADEPDDD